MRAIRCHRRTDNAWPCYWRVDRRLLRAHATSNIRHSTVGQRLHMEVFWALRPCRTGHRHNGSHRAFARRGHKRRARLFLGWWADTRLRDRNKASCTLLGPRTGRADADIGAVHVHSTVDGDGACVVSRLARAHAMFHVTIHDRGECVRHAERSTSARTIVDDGCHDEPRRRYQYV